MLQERDGQTKPSHSISAGLDYPGVGPEHASLALGGRAVYVPISDEEAMAAFLRLSRTEGIIPAIESAHALAGALQWAEESKRVDGGRDEERIILVNLSGRGDKDMETAAQWFGFGEPSFDRVDPSAEGGRSVDRGDAPELGDDK